jgi:Rps23 Pro-64 3,4-dihydroxylase Tpa1-like proline 4-hydroxylase
LVENTQKLTLPISLVDGFYLDPKEARSFGTMLADDYASAKPYPYIVIDDFLPASLADGILANFPVGLMQGDVLHMGGYGGQNKRQVSPNDCNEYVRNLFSFFNSAPFIQFLEGLTGIEGLIPDPYFNGGGFHEIRRGGKLGVHADFRINEQLHLSRRLNVLIYLNKGWDDDFGGKFEIWSKDALNMERAISPLFNRCVVFNTDGNSYHGHPEALNSPDNVTRKSIALYYYTASKAIYTEVNSHGTMYVARPGDGFVIRKEVVRHNIINYVRDWMLPPMIYRQIRKGIQRIKKSLLR